MQIFIAYLFTNQNKQYQLKVSTLYAKTAILATGQASYIVHIYLQKLKKVSLGVFHHKKWICLLEMFM